MSSRNCLRSRCRRRSGGGSPGGRGPACGVHPRSRTRWRAGAAAVSRRSHGSPRRRAGRQPTVATAAARSCPRAVGRLRCRRSRSGRGRRRPSPSSPGARTTWASACGERIVNVGGCRSPAPWCRPRSAQRTGGAVAPGSSSPQCPVRANGTWLADGLQGFTCAPRRLDAHHVVGDPENFSISSMNCADRSIWRPPASQKPGGGRERVVGVGCQASPQVGIASHAKLRASSARS